MSVFVPGYTRSDGSVVRAYTKKKRPIRKSTSKKGVKHRLSQKQIRLLKAQQRSRLRKNKR